jgi:hypothetical protein
MFYAKDFGWIAPQTFNLFEASTIYVEQADPLVFLLEVAHNAQRCDMRT